MSKPNFETQENFNLYLYKFITPSEEEINKELIENYSYKKEEITEKIRNSYIQNLYEISCADTLEELPYALEEVTKNKPLQFFTVTIKSGHYTGLQFYVKHKTNCSWFTDILNNYSISEIPNNYIKEYCNMCRSEFIRKYKSEINYINKKVLPKLANILSFKQYYCSGIFSNGEAIYREVTNSKREQLLKAVA